MKAILKIGDTIKISNKNKNHSDNDVCAYANMCGVVTNIWEDNSFALCCGNSTLIVPMRNAFKKKIKGIWIYLNEELLFHKSK